MLIRALQLMRCLRKMNRVLAALGTVRVVLPLVILLLFVAPSFVFAQGKLTSVKVTPSDSTAGAGTIYTVSFITSATGGPGGIGIPANGKIRLTFPAGFVNSTVSLAVNAAGGALTGGYLAPADTGQVLTLTRDGTGNNLVAPDTVIIKLASVYNSTVAGQFTLFVETLNSAGARIDTARSEAFRIVPGLLHHFTLNNVPTVSAGASFDLIIQAKDIYENTVTKFTGTVGIALNSGVISPTTSGAFSAGIRTESMTIQTAGSGKIISVTDGSGHTGTSNVFSVDPGQLHHFAVSNIPTPQTAGVGFAVTFTAQDQFNNTVTGFTGTVAISDSTNTLTPTTSGNFIAGVRTETVTIAQARATNRITVTGNAKTGSSNVFAVNVGPLDHFAISSISTVTAGTPFNFTITAKDAKDNTVTSFTGTINLSDNTNTLTPPTANITSNGTVTVTGAIITKAQSGVFITAMSGGNITGTSNTFIVLHGPLDHFAVTNTSGGNIGSQVAGMPFNIRLVAQDAYNNTATAFTGTVNLSNTTTSITPTSSGNFSSGVLASLPVTIGKASTADQISVSGGSPVKTGASNNFVVSAGTLAGFLLDPISSPQTAGTPFPLKITAVDANGNIATSFTGTVNVSLNSGTITPAVTTNFVNGVWNGNVTVLTSGTGKTITVTNGTFSATSNSFTVNPAAAMSFAVTNPSDGNIGSQTAGTNFSIKITAKDANGNVVTGFTGTVTLSDNTGSLTPTSATITSGGTVTVNNVKITKALASVAITASSGSVTGTSNEFAVTHAVLDHFSVTNTSDGNIASQQAGTPFNIKIVARDLYENIVASFTGSVALSNTTSSISPTTSGNFTNGVLASFSVTIAKTSAADVISVSSGTPVKTGNSNSFVVSSAGLAGFRLDPISSPQIAGTPFPLTITAIDANQNTVTSFTGTVGISVNSGTITPTNSGNFVAGVWNGNVTVLTSGANKTITVSDGTRSTTSNSFNVNPGLLDHFELASIAAQTAGANFTVTVTAKDANNNNVTHTGTVTLSDNTGTLTASSLVFSAQATQTVSDVKINKAQSGVFVTASGSGKNGFSNNFTVNPAALDHFTVTNTTGGNIISQTAGTAFNIRVEARDVYENTVTSFNQTVTITDLTTLNLTSANFVSGVLASQSVTINQARTDNQLTVTGGSPSRTGVSNLFNVIPGGLDHFTIDSITDQAAGEPFVIVIRARDAKDNVATSFNGTVTISDLTGSIAPATSGTFINGVRNESVKITLTRTNDIITVSGGGKTGSSNAFNVGPSTVDHFAITNIGNQTAGQPFSVTITALDASNNLVTSFNGTVTISDLSSSITPTTSNAFSGGTLTQNFTITKSYTGDRITVTGVGKTSTSNAFNVVPGPLHHFAINSISNQTAGSSFPITITAQDVNNNTVTGFTGTVTISINTGTIQPVTSGTFASGIRIESVTIAEAGNNRIINVNDGSGHSGSSNAFNVAAGGLDHFAFSTIATQAAGAAFSFTITAKDANNNDLSFNGTVTLSDNTTTLTPTSVTMNGVSVTVSNAQITKAQTGVMISATGGGKTGKSNAFTVQPGSLYRVRIVEGPSGDGPEVTTKSVTADDLLPLHAAGYDAFGNYREDPPVNWLMTNALGVFTPASSTSSTTFNPNKVGTTRLIADHASAIDDSTGNVVISTGAAYRVKVLLGAFGAGNEVGDVLLNTGEVLTVHASSFDRDDNRIQDVSVTWRVSGNIGTLSPLSGVSTTLTATRVGNGTITADHASLIDGYSGIITVSASTLSYVKIFEGTAGPPGAELGNKSITTDQTLSVYAAGFDASGNYVGDQEVTWSLSNSLGTLSPTFGRTTNFDPKRPGTLQIIATHATATGDNTGNISISAGNAHHIKILTGLSGATSEFLTDTLFTGQTREMHASSFDADDNWLGDVSVTWSVSNPIGSVAPTVGAATTFTATTAGSGVINARHSILGEDFTGTITVKPSSLNYVRIVEGPSGPGSKLGSKSFTTDQTVPVHAAGYDANNNYLGDVPVTWTVIGNNIGTFTTQSGASTTLLLTRTGVGRIVADHASAKDDTSGNLTISVGALHHVKVMSGNAGFTSVVLTQEITADETLAVHASGFDADDNYIDDFSVTWLVSGKIGTVSPAVGKSTILTARKVGVGQITADYADPNVTDGVTGAITVNPGRLAFIWVIEGPSGAGTQLGDRSLKADETLTLHAAGFDADTNYVADQSVTWSSAGSLAPAVSATGSNFTFAPTTAPASGTIRATHATAGFDETGTISVTVGSLNKIKILSGGSGKTTEVTGTTLPAGGTLLIHAGGFDSDDNYINDQIANWSVVGSIGTVNPANGFSTTFTATTPGTGAIRASVGSLSDNTGTIQVITGNIAKIVLRTASGNGGIAFGDHSMTADQEVIICAAGYDATNNYLGDFNVTWSNTGNLTPAVSATGSSFTFSPTLANANGTVNGKIIGTYSPTIKDTTGTITVYPGAPVGKISLTATPSGLPSDGSSRSTIVSGTIKDAELNNVGAGKRFTVTVTPSNLGTITTPDLDPATPDVQIETDASSQLRFEFKAGTTGGIASINVSSGLSANGSVQISLGSLDITDVTTVPATVSRGQQGISVGMTVRNLSSAPITDLTGQLTFTGSANRTGEYTVVPSPGNLTTLPGNSTTQLLFNVEVSNGATLETVTINGSVSGKIDGTVVNDNEATQTDSWTVQRAAVLSVLNVTTAPDTVARGQTGLAVTVRVANNLNLDNSASATIDSVKLVFKQGALDRTVEYVIAPDANNPTSITGNSTASFNFIVNVGLTASLGQVTLDARAHGKDANSNRAISDFNADAPDTWTVIEGEAFRIVSLTPSQPKVTAGMTSLTKEWNVRMTVENTGSSRIALNLAPDKTYIRFTIGTRDVTSEYNIIYPSALEEGGTELAARSTGHLTYRITRTGTSDGIAVISGAAEGQDRATGLTVFADTRISGTGEVNVQRPAVFRIDQLVLSQRTITQNMLKDWWIKAVVANAGGSDIRLHPSRDSIKVSIGNNAGYIYIRPSTFASGDTILAGNETDSLLIMVDKTGSQTGDLPVAVTLKGIEVNSNTLLNSNTANSTVTVQTPAALQILAVHPSRQTVSVGQTTPWTVTVVVKNNGGSQVSVKSDTSTNLRFRITQFQNDYNVSLQPTTWLGSASTNLAGNATDSLRFVVNTTGATPGFAFLWVKVAATENNSGVVVASPYHNSKSVQVQTRPNIVYMANSLRPKIVNNNSSYAFTVRVRNTGQATLQLEPDSTKLRFSAGAATYLASLDANQVRTLVPSVPGDTATLTFRSVAIPENMPQTTYTPVVELRGTENENNFSSNLTLTANELRVTQPAQVQILSVEPSQSTVTAHMTKPWNVTMIVRNNGNFRAKLDSVNLRLLSGIDVTREYGIVIPTNFLGSTTALLEAQRTDSLRFVINTTGNTLGNTAMQIRLFMTDQSNGQRIDPPPESNTSFMVQSRADLKITSLVPSQPTVTRNQIQVWTVDMNVINLGGSEVQVDFTGTATKILLSLNSGDYIIQSPDSLLSGGKKLAGGANGTLRFKIIKTGSSTGRNDITGQITATELNSGATRTDDTQDGGAGFVTVQMPAQLRVKRTMLAGALNLPHVNVGQGFAVNVTVENFGEEAADSVQVRLISTNGTSQILPAIKEVVGGVPGAQTQTVTFNITASSTENPAEQFRANIFAGKAHNTRVNITPSTAEDDTAVANIQSPAALRIQRVATSVPTVSAGQTQPWFIYVIVTNAGGAALTLNQPNRDDITVQIDGVTQTDYAITADPVLIHNGSLSLTANEIDTVRYTVTFTGAQRGGQASILATLTAKDKNDNASLRDDEVGQIEVITTATLQIVKTEPVVNRTLAGSDVGLVNVEQVFYVEVTVQNISRFEDVKDVRVQLRSNSNRSHIAEHEKIISGIKTLEFQKVAFTIQADTGIVAGLENEIFSARLVSALTSPGEQPATILPSADSTAQVLVQRPAKLSVTVAIQDDRRILATNQTFDFSATVTNSGQAEVDENGLLELKLPAGLGFTIASGDPAERPFTVGKPVIWRLRAPTNGIDSATLQVQITTPATDLNSNTPAALDKDVDELSVQVVPSDLKIIKTYVSQPDGARDGTVSTDQTFKITTELAYSRDLRNGDINLIVVPEDYRVIGPQQPVFQEMVTWEVQAPSTPYEVPKYFVVRASGINGRGELRVVRDSISVITVEKASLNFSAQISSPEGARDGTVSVGQLLTVSATLLNDGTAGVRDTAKVKLELAPNGFTTTDTLEKVIQVGGSVDWQIKAPESVGDDIITVRFSRVPVDENTGNSAAIQANKRIERIPVRVDSVGYLKISSFTIISPRGASDRIVSTGQQFTVQLELEANRVVSATAELRLPAGYSTNETLVRSFAGQIDGKQFVKWTIQAPSQPGLAGQADSIRVEVKGKDANNDVVLLPTARKVIDVQVVERAVLSLFADITNPLSARDKVVSRNQNFEVTARLLKTGQASVRGTAKIELILPSDPRIEPAQNYRTAEPLQKELADGVVTWQITARSQPSTVIDNIRLRLLRPYPVDENTDSLATVEDVEVAIPVQTESKRLIVQSLPQTVLGPVALGESSSLLMRLKLTNQGDLNSTNILLRGFTWRVRDRENKPVPANQAIKALHLVVTNHPEHVLGSLTAIPVSDTVRMSLTALDTLIGGVPDSVDVLVDVADNKSAKTFQLAFASATDVDAIDQDSRDPVEIVFLDDRGTTVDAGAIASKMRVVIEANYQKSFYNFPNPFSPRSSNPEEKVTYFNYFLPQASDVEFRIFTLLGELVYARSFKSTDPQGAAGPRGNAGYIVWDGHNGDGREVLNGVYIAILKTSAGTVSTKVAVVK